MDLWHIIILALIQGITEFLPISSSAHLILLPRLAGWTDQGLAFDVALHLGSLMAVLAYFRRELGPLFIRWWADLRQRQSTPESRLVWAVAWATVPVGLAGLLWNDYVDESLRSPLVIAATTIGFGLLLGVADRFGRGGRDEFSLTWRDVAIIGLAQALALIPGTSRSGITMTAALLLGWQRRASARFSFLLAIPVILLAGGLEIVKLAQSPQAVAWDALLLGTLFSGLSAYACIRLFIGFLERIGMMPFVIYRLLLGALLLWIFAV